MLTGYFIVIACIWGDGGCLRGWRNCIRRSSRSGCGCGVVVVAVLLVVGVIVVVVVVIVVDVVMVVAVVIVGPAVVLDIAAWPALVLALADMV